MHAHTMKSFALGFSLLTSSNIPGKEPTINPANKLTIPKTKFSKAQSNKNIQGIMATIIPSKIGNNVKKDLTKCLRILLIESTIVLKMPKITAIVPPETPGTDETDSVKNVQPAPPA